ncbi:MAG: hypothetical protein Q8L47_02815 [bacterium]|nr:hypothetical protein [bacterium]
MKAKLINFIAIIIIGVICSGCLAHIITAFIVEKDTINPQYEVNRKRLDRLAIYGYRPTWHFYATSLDDAEVFRLEKKSGKVLVPFDTEFTKSDITPLFDRLLLSFRAGWSGADVVGFQTSGRYAPERFCAIGQCYSFVDTRTYVLVDKDIFDKAFPPPDCTNPWITTREEYLFGDYLIVGIYDIISRSGVDVRFITPIEVKQDEPISSCISKNCKSDAEINSGLPIGYVKIRNKRDNAGNGRVYHIKFKASDILYKQCFGVASVCIPISPGTPCIDGGPLYNSLAK